MSTSARIFLCFPDQIFRNGLGFVKARVLNSQIRSGGDNDKCPRKARCSVLKSLGQCGSLGPVNIIGIIKKARFYLSRPSLLTLYFALVYPYLQYGTIVWGSTYKPTLSRLVVLQKRIIRVITKSCFDAPSAPLFYEHNFLHLSYIYKLQIGLFMFSFKNKLLLVGFHGLFLFSSQLHTYNTRNAMNYRSQFFRTNFRKFTIAYQGPNVWNTLPAELKDGSSKNVFRKNLHRFLVQQVDLS